MYHIVCPAKYRRVVIDEGVDKTLKETCEEISKRYEIVFLEIKEIFKKHPEVKEKLLYHRLYDEN
jgi:hypothetical protein